MSVEKKKINLPDKFLPSIPLTREELHAASRKRVSLISKEFAAGFEFLEDYPKSVTFFGSSRAKTDSESYEKAVSLSRRIVKELGYSIVTGGGPGIMEAANRGAFEAQGSSLGITIELPHEQVTNSYLTDHIPLYYFFSRKVCLSFSAEAYVFFPGGFGTMDEFFEILTLVQTKKINSVPIILVGSSYWKPLEEFIEKQILPKGMIDKEDMSLYHISDNESEIIEIIRKSPVRIGDNIINNDGK